MNKALDYPLLANVWLAAAVIATRPLPQLFCLFAAAVFYALPPLRMSAIFAGISQPLPNLTTSVGKYNHLVPVPSSRPTNSLKKLWITVSHAT